MNRNILQFRHVNKYYKSSSGTTLNQKALNNISFTIKEKKSIGFIIEDETVRHIFTDVISGLESPDAGKILLYDKETYFDGYPYEGLGLLLNEPSFMNTHDGFSNLKMLSEYNESYENDRISKMMSYVGLDPLSETKVCNYSSAMFKKLCLAYALIPNNELLVLPEPFKHLNEYALKEFLRIYNNLRTKKTIIYIAPTHTHLGGLCDNVYLIENSELIKVI